MKHKIILAMRKKNPKQDNKAQDKPEIKNYIDRINQITRNKHK